MGEEAAKREKVAAALHPVPVLAGSVWDAQGPPSRPVQQGVGDTSNEPAAPARRGTQYLSTKILRSRVSRLNVPVSDRGIN